MIISTRGIDVAEFNGKQTNNFLVRQVACRGAWNSEFAENCVEVWQAIVSDTERFANHFDLVDFVS